MSLCASISLASPSDPAQITASVRPEVIHPGEIAEVVVTAKIDPGWHLYSLVPVPPPGPSATVITILGKGFKIAGQVSEDAALSFFDNNFGKSVSYHINTATFIVPIQITTTRPQSIDAQVSINYQTCNDSVCLPPRTKSIPLTIVVTPGLARQQYSHPMSQPANDTGLVWFLLAAFGGGLLSLATPCVFPLIPITLSSFVKQADGDKRRLFRLSIGYSFGIVLLYVSVGLLTTFALGASGISRLATNPWVNLSAFAVFLIFALSFFETIRFEIPANLGALQSLARKQGGWLGLVALGIIFVLASFTCTAPFVGTLLVTAAGGSYFRPLLGMLVFSTAFVSPFLLFSCFPQWLSRVPKSGLWLARLKATLGFIEIAASLKFLSNADLIWQWKVLTEPVLLAAWAIILFCTALYLVNLLRFGIIAEIEPAELKITPIQFALSGLFIAGAVYCFWGLSGRTLNPYISAYLPPEGYGGTTSASVIGLPWLSDYDTAIAAARNQSKPLLIDFTGYTCTNCRLNEKQILPSPVVQQELSKFVLVQLYTDGGRDAAQNEQLEIDKFGDAALPLYGIINPRSGAVVSSTAGIQTINGFTDFMKRAEKPASTQQEPWTPFTESALDISTTEQRPTIIDFTATWCTNCKAIEKSVFTDKLVTSRLSEFDTFKCDMTNYYAAKNLSLEKKYSIVSLPAILFLDKDGREVPGTRVNGLLTAPQFAAKMDRALQTYKDGT